MQRNVFITFLFFSWKKKWLFPGVNAKMKFSSSVPGPDKNFQRSRSFPGIPRYRANPVKIAIQSDEPWKDALYTEFVVIANEFWMKFVRNLKQKDLKEILPWQDLSRIKTKPVLCTSLYLSLSLQQYLSFNKRQVFQKFSISKMHFNICIPLWTASFSNNSFFFLRFHNKKSPGTLLNEFQCYMYFQSYNSPVNRLYY